MVGEPGLVGIGSSPSRSAAIGPAGLGLPPVVDDGDAEQAARPAVGLRVQPLARQEEVLQAGQVVRAHQLAVRILLLDGPERGRRGEHRLHAVLGDRPARTRRRRGCRPACPRRAPWCTRSAAARRRCRNGRRPSRCRRPPSRCRRAGRRTRSPCSSAAPPRGRRCRAPRPWASRSCRMCTGCTAGRSRPPARSRTGEAAAVACAQSRSRPSTMRRDGLRALQDQAVAGLVAGHLDRPVEQRLVLDDPARLDAARRRHDHPRLRVLDPHRQLVRREPAEHDRVHGAEPGAGQHGDHGLGNHRHVDDHPVALADAEARKRPGEDRRPPPAARGRRCGGRCR